MKNIDDLTEEEKQLINYSWDKFKAVIERETPQTNAFWKSMEGYCGTYENWAEKVQVEMQALERRAILAEMKLLVLMRENEDPDPDVRRLEIHYDMNERMGE